MKNNLYKKYSFYLIMSLIITTIGVFLGQFLPLEGVIIYSIFSIILVIAFLFTKGKIKRILFFLFCLGEGATLTPIIIRFSNISVLGIILLTTLMVSIFVLIGYKCKNLSFLGGTLFICLIGFVLYNILGLFFNLPILSLFGVGLFCVYVSYDFNQFKNNANSTIMSDDDVLDSVMEIYLDILNIFVNLLEILSLFDN